MTFPNDTRTISQELVGATTATILPTGTNTILHVSIKQSGVASDSWLYCGTSIVSKNYAQEFVPQEMRYLCKNEPMTISKTGTDNSFFIVTYVPRNLTLEPNLINYGSGFMLFNAIILFFITMWFIIWFFRRT